jgi:F-box-like
MLGYLDLRDFEAVRCVCKRLHLACDDERLWKRLCQELIPFAFKDDGAKSYKEILHENYINTILYINVPEWGNKQF